MHRLPPDLSRRRRPAREVSASGPRASVHHPATPGSWWAYIPVVITVALMMLRTALEDRTLRAELPGYAQYTEETRWRLVPGIWQAGTRYSLIRSS